LTPRILSLPLDFCPGPDVFSTMKADVSSALTIRSGIVSPKSPGRKVHVSISHLPDYSKAIVVIED